MPDKLERVKPIQGRNPWAKPTLITLVISYITFLILVPIVGILKGAFAEGVGGFLRVLCNRDVLYAFALTFLLSAVAVILNTVFGIAIAWILVRQDFPGKRFVNAIVDLPFAVSPVVAGYMLILLFGRTGWFHWFTELTGIKIIFSLPGMLLATTFVSLPFVIREVMPVLQEIGPEQEQAAHTLGAGDWQAFWRVTFPGIRWGLFYGITLTFARAMGEFGALLVVSGAVNGELETATLFVFRAMDERMYSAAYTVSIVLASVSFFVVIAMETLKKRLREET